MLDEWRRRFLEDGEVEVRVSRRTGGLGMLAAGLGFGLPGVYFLVTPGVANPFGLGPSRVVGVIGVLMGLVGLTYGIRMLARPILLLRLDRNGLQVAPAPPATWDEVEGAQPRRMLGSTLAEVTFGPTFWERVEAGDPKRARGMRNDAIGGNEGSLVVRGPAPGGVDAMVRLVLWAREEVDRTS